MTLAVSFDFYPLLVLCGVIAAFAVVEIYFRKIKMKKGVSTNIEIALTISAAVGIVCAILFQNLYDFIEDPSTYTWTWAMTFFGGLIGGVLCYFAIYFLYLRKHNPPFLKEFMVIAGSGIPLAHGFGRIGCFVSGCCYGTETDSIFGVVFPSTNGVKVWPTNLFEAIFLFVLAIILFILAYKKNSRLCFPIYMISYGIFRFCIEFLRGDHRGSFIPGISPSQFWAIIIFLGGIAYLIYVIVTWKNKVVIPEDKEEISKTEKGAD